MNRLPAVLLALLIATAVLSGCNLDSAVEVPFPEEFATDAFPTSPPSGGGITPDGDECDVTRVIDGDTIDVQCGDVGYRVRYVAVNTPESDESCYNDATNANATLVKDKRVTLVRDESNTDRYGRLLRYVYVDGTFVNESLVRNGWAEAVVYQPDDLHYADFVTLEQTATAQNIGCHPTGIFNDGDERR